MTDNPDNEFKAEHPQRFGQVAVKMGFITGAQLKAAINDQIDDDLADRSHRFLGDILLEKRWITFEQVDIILDELFKEEMRIKGKL